MIIALIDTTFYSRERPIDNKTPRGGVRKGFLR